MYTCSFLLVMLYKPEFHGTYVEDILFGIIFIVMLAVFSYFYFSDQGEPELEDDEESLKFIDTKLQNGDER